MAMANRQQTAHVMSRGLPALSFGLSTQPSRQRTTAQTHRTRDGDRPPGPGGLIHPKQPLSRERTSPSVCFRRPRRPWRENAADWHLPARWIVTGLTGGAFGIRECPAAAPPGA